MDKRRKGERTTSSFARRLSSAFGTSAGGRRILKPSFFFTSGILVMATAQMSLADLDRLPAHALVKFSHDGGVAVDRVSHDVHQMFHLVA